MNLNSIFIQNYRLGKWGSFALLDLIVIIVSIILFFYANFNGLGLTFDSNGYLQAAEQIKEGRSIEDIYPYYKNRFPFQTLEIYLLSLFNSNPANGMMYVHALTLLLTVTINIYIGNQIFKDPFILVFYKILILSGIPLLLVHSFLWTEPLFILLLSLEMLFLLKFLKSKKAIYLTVIFLLSILCCWQRKAGMIFLLGISVALLFQIISNKKLILIFLSLIFFSVFWLYGGFGGVNYIGELPRPSSFYINFYNYSGTIGAWILPLPIPYSIRLIVLIMLSITMCYMIYSHWNQIDSSTRQFITCILIIISFYLFIRHFYHRLHFDEAERLLSPVYLMICIIVSSGFEALMFKLRGFKKWKRLLIICLLIWTIYPTSRVIKNANLWHNRAKNPLTL